MNAIKEILGEDGENQKIVDNMLGEEKEYAEKYEKKSKKFKGCHK